LQEAQTRLELQIQKFDSEVTDLREKLVAAKSQEASTGSWLYSSKIAKPMRGGVASPGDEETVLAAAESSSAYKRSSCC
jgi:hypothetical protein